MSGAKPIVVGVLGDRPGDQSAMVGVMREVVEAAVVSGRIDRPVEFVVDITDGLPEGTAASLTAGFHRLVAQDALVIMGPTVTDNGLVATELADEFRIPCCNWTGSDRTRSEWMFHYQIGSLEEEPHLMAGHLASLGHTRCGTGTGPLPHREPVRSLLRERNRASGSADHVQDAHFARLE